MPNWEMPEDAGCPTCRGRGWLRRDLPVGDPEFGQAMPCPDCSRPIGIVPSDCPPEQAEQCKRDAIDGEPTRPEFAPPPGWEPLWPAWPYAYQGPPESDACSEPCPYTGIPGDHEAAARAEEWFYERNSMIRDGLSWCYSHKMWEPVDCLFDFPCSETFREYEAVLLGKLPAQKPPVPRPDVSERAFEQGGPPSPQEMPPEAATAPVRPPQAPSRPVPPPRPKQGPSKWPKPIR